MKKADKFIAILLTIFVLASCENDQLALADQDLLEADLRTTLVEDADLFLVLSHYEGESLIPNCANINITNPNTFPRTYTIDFGSSGCTDLDGVTRKGRITATFSGPVTSVLGQSLSIVRSEDYTVNGYGMRGTFTFTNTSTSSTMRSFVRSLTDGAMIYPNGEEYLVSTTPWVVNQVEGGGNTTLNDDTYRYVKSGENTGTRRITRPDGSYLETTILTPLTRRLNCDKITSGTLRTKGTTLEGVLNYGTAGECDGIARYIAGINAFTINF